MTALKLIAQEEGFREKPYRCSEGVLTIGHGFTYITREESIDILKGRVHDLYETLADKYDWFSELSMIRQSVIISMVYQLGLTGFSHFKKCIKAIERHDWKRAADEMKDSRAYRQTKNRWDRQIELFING